MMLQQTPATKSSSSFAFIRSTYNIWLRCQYTCQVVQATRTNCKVHNLTPKTWQCGYGQGKKSLLQSFIYVERKERGICARDELPMFITSGRRDYLHAPTYFIISSEHEHQCATVPRFWEEEREAACRTEVIHKILNVIVVRRLIRVSHIRNHCTKMKRGIISPHISKWTCTQTLTGFADWYRIIDLKYRVLIRVPLLFVTRTFNVPLGICTFLTTTLWSYAMLKRKQKEIFWSRRYYTEKMDHLEMWDRHLQDVVDTASSNSCNVQSCRIPVLRVDRSCDMSTDEWRSNTHVLCPDNIFEILHVEVSADHLDQLNVKRHCNSWRRDRLMTCFSCPFHSQKDLNVRQQCAQVRICMWISASDRWWNTIKAGNSFGPSQNDEEIRNEESMKERGT